MRLHTSDDISLEMSDLTRTSFFTALLYSATGLTTTKIDDPDGPYITDGVETFQIMDFLKEGCLDLDAIVAEFQLKEAIERPDWLRRVVDYLDRYYWTWVGHMTALMHAVKEDGTAQMRSDLLANLMACAGLFAMIINSQVERGVDSALMKAKIDVDKAFLAILNKSISILENEEVKALMGGVPGVMTTGIFIKMIGEAYGLAAKGRLEDHFITVSDGVTETVISAEDIENGWMNVHRIIASNYPAAAARRKLK